MQQTYQLTNHPSGSKREFWSMTWPLMIGLLSSTLMLFVDRMLLARWNPLALNAAVSGGMAYYMFLVIPMGIVEVAEVLVGRLNGEERQKEIGAAVWQMVWMAAILWPLFYVIGWSAPALLFNGSGNETYETSYFTTLMASCAAFQCATISLSGFFIGTGNVKIVTISAIMGNVINIVLDYWMIFGGGPMPELGVVGAAAATAIAQFAQMVFLMVLFLRPSNRTKYGTGSSKIHAPVLLEGLRIGFPSGAGRSFEVFAHFLFFRVVLSVGPEQMALVAIAQSIYILSSFIIDAQSKGASAIVANLLGAEQRNPIGQVLRSSFTLHAIYFFIMLTIVWALPEQIYSLFSAEEGVAFILTPELSAVFQRALICVSLFFLFDGLGWIVIGFLTAAKDTRFVFWVSLLVNCIAYLPLTLWLIGVQKRGG